MVSPPPLRPGDRVAVVAPSSPFPRQELLVGMAWLRARYTLVARDTMASRDGFLAGDDARRRDELAAAMARDDVKAIVAARGGYGATRIVSSLPWEALVRHPKWLVGFSDITALHLCAGARGLRTVHGPNVTGLGPPRPWLRHCFLRALERPDASFEWNQLERPREGDAEGVAVGGNLALVEATAAAGALEVPEGAIVFLEDVTERPYRIDRMLTALRMGGHFARASAVVFGSFTDCVPGPDGYTVAQVLARFAADVGLPVASNAPFGHGERNDAFVLGRTVRLRGPTLTFV